MSVHLLLGEPVLVRERSDRIVQEVFGDARPVLNYAVFGADDGAPGAIELARTVPMMAKLRVVVIRQLEAAGGPLMNDLLAYVESPSPSTVLVMTGTALPTSAGALGPGRKLEPLVKKVGEVARPKSGDVDPVRFVLDTAKKRGISIDQAAAKALVGAIGDSLGSLRLELDKVATFVGPDAPVDVAAVEACVRPIRDTDAFELAAAIVRRDVNKALAVAHRLFEVDPHAGHAIIGPLTWNVRSLLLLQECVQTGRNPYDAGVRMRSSDMSAAKDLVRKHPLDGERVLNRLARAYRDMHEMKASECDLFELLVIDLIGR